MELTNVSVVVGRTKDGRGWLFKAMGFEASGNLRGQQHALLDTEIPGLDVREWATRFADHYQVAVRDTINALISTWRHA